uniref:Putative cellulase n=1 Tax=uncultured bacterium Ad_010_C07 TaxID=1489291 RepID=A0A0B4N049_9BACT|nr:putative cellulase [uncultured bacterium Ad_010_C07]
MSGEDFVINEAWLDRVQELVDWALECGLHVIVNTHHDNFKAYYYPDEEHLDGSIRYVTAIWTQVAARFADYDERLIFESLNEPRLAGTNHEWWFEADSAECMAAAECINRLNQAFVDTVRASGGVNATRYLMVPGYDAAPANTVPEIFRLPEDSADNRIIVSAHAYLPYSFALDTKGGSEFSIRNLQQTGEIAMAMNGLYERFISQGVPVVMGEFGALNKDNLQARVDLTAYYVASASARGIPCVWWDNHAFHGKGENFGLLDRRTLEWPCPEIVEAAMRYALH